MGMDYQYAGSASYPRFNRELECVVKIFGGVLKAEIQEKIKEVPEGTIDWWFGKPLTDDEGEKYIFPEEMSSTFMKWVNHPYDDLSLEETKEIYEILLTHQREVENVSIQIMQEFDYLVNYDEYWHIS